MNNKLIVPLSIAAIVVAIKVHNAQTLKEVKDAYPLYDPQIIEKAHYRLCRKAFRRHLDTTKWSREKYERLLFKEIAKIS